MAPARMRVPDLLLWIIAFAWPFGVFLQTPIPGVGLLTLAALLLLPFVVPQALSDRKLLIPFEVWAPAAILALLAAVWTWTDPRPLHRETAEAMLLLALIVQLGPERDAINRYVFAGAIAAGAVAATSLAAPRVGLIPTAFTFRSGADFTFPYSLSEGVHILLVGAAFSLHALMTPCFSRWQRAVGGGSLTIIATLLVVRALEWWRDTEALPFAPYPAMWTGQLAAAAVALWLFVRVLAKVEVDRRAAPDPLHRLWWMVGVATILVAACAPLHPRAYQGVLLGFACATVLSARSTAPAWRWRVIGSIVVAVVVGINLLTVFPANANDPRQYDAAAQREMPRIFDRMDWIDRHAPHERRTYLWRARAAMESGLPNLASFAFKRAVHPPDGPALLPPPSETERQQFLVRMRDTAAALPEDRAVCAYERVLLASGERDSALYSLRLRTGVPLIHVEAEEAAPYARVAALVLGDPLVAEDLRSWTADEILTLLSLWGTDVAFASEPAEAPGGLFVLAAQRGWDTINVHVRAGERVTEISEPVAPVTQREIAPLTEVRVMVWAGPVTDGGGTRYTLNVLAGGGVRPAAHVDIYADGAAQWTWVEDPPVIAFTPAVRVRIAK